MNVEGTLQPGYAVYEQKQPVTGHLQQYGSKKCCCCKGCCLIHFGVTLGTGLSGIWALLALVVQIAGVEYFLFNKVFNVVFMSLFAISCLVAFVITIVNKYWFLCGPYLICTAAYVILLGVSACRAFFRAISKNEGEPYYKTEYGTNLDWLINFTMFFIQSWNLLYAAYIVYHMRKDHRLRHPKGMMKIDELHRSPVVEGPPVQATIG